MKMVDKATRLSQSMAKKNEYGESSKYVTFKSTSKGEKTDDKVVTEINEAQIEKDLKLAGYNLLVTSEVNMASKDIYSTYHNLWRIEESFRIMKSDLDARPVFLQKEDTIKGHFLICYLTVLLGRILQFKILENKYSSSEIFNFNEGIQCSRSRWKIHQSGNQQSLYKGVCKDDKAASGSLYIELQKNRKSAELPILISEV